MWIAIGIATLDYHGSSSRAGAYMCAPAHDARTTAKKPLPPSRFSTRPSSPLRLVIRLERGSLAPRRSAQSADPASRELSQQRFAEFVSQGPSTVPDGSVVRVQPEVEPHTDVP